MASIKFQILSKSEQSPIYLRLSIRRGNTPRRKTGLVINPKDWSNSKGLPKQNNGNNKNLSSVLRKLESFIIERYNSSNANGDTIDGNWLSFNIDLFFERVSENTKSELLTDAIESIINSAKLRTNAKGDVGLSKTRISSYRALLSSVREFQVSISLKVKDVDLELSQNFLKFLLDEKGYNKSTALKRIADLKTVCYDAEANGIKVSPQLKKIKSSKTKNDNIIFLTPTEIQKISNTSLDKDYLINARKWLLLGCSIGQRASDLLELTDNNFVTRNGLDVIELTQKKTSKKITIPVLTETSKILESGLPRKISQQKLNNYIKEICRISNIDEVIVGNLFDSKTKRKVHGKYPKYKLISTHVCRRSFATNLYGKLPTPLIMQITGHSTEKMFLNYIGKNSLDYAQQIADFYTLQAQKEKKESSLKLVSNMR